MRKRGHAMQKMLSYVRRAVDHYNMIKEGDRVAVGVSGGKDSLALLVALTQLSRFYPEKFEVVAITLEMGYDEMDFSPVQALCDRLGVEYIRVPTQIGPIIFDIRHEENPCALCAKMRDSRIQICGFQAQMLKMAVLPWLIVWFCDQLNFAVAVSKKTEHSSVFERRGAGIDKAQNFHIEFF